MSYQTDVTRLKPRAPEAAEELHRCELPRLNRLPNGPQTDTESQVKPFHHLPPKELVMYGRRCGLFTLDGKRSRMGAEQAADKSPNFAFPLPEKWRTDQQAYAASSTDRNFRTGQVGECGVIFH